MKSNKGASEKFENENQSNFFSTFYSKNKNYVVRSESLPFSFQYERKMKTKKDHKKTDKPPDVAKTSYEGPYVLKSPREMSNTVKVDKEAELKPVSASLSGKVLEPIKSHSDQNSIMRQTNAERMNNMKTNNFEYESEKAEDKMLLLNDILRGKKVQKNVILSNEQLIASEDSALRSRNIVNGLNKTTIGFSRINGLKNKGFIEDPPLDTIPQNYTSQSKRNPTFPATTETSLSLNHGKNKREAAAGVLFNEFNLSLKHPGDHFIRTLPYYSYTSSKNRRTEEDKRPFREIMLESAQFIASGRGVDSELFEINSRGVSLPNIFDRVSHSRGHKPSISGTVMPEPATQQSKRIKDFITELHNDNNSELVDVINKIHNSFFGSGSGQYHQNKNGLDNQANNTQQIDINLIMIERLRKVTPSNIIASSIGEPSNTSNSNELSTEPNEHNDNISVYIKKLVESLKKESRNPFSNVPAGRPEVLALRDWFLKTLQGISSETGFSRKEKLVLADEVFNICLQEIIRQVSYNCFERGELLLIMWDNYIELFRKVFQSEREMIGRLKQESEVALQNTIQEHESKLKLKLTDIKERDFEIIELRGELKQLKEQLQFSRARENEQDKKMNMLKELLRRMKIETRNALNENVLLKEKIDVYEIMVAEMKLNNKKLNKNGAEEKESDDEIPVKKEPTKDEELKADSEDQKSEDEEIDKDLQELLGISNVSPNAKDKGGMKNWESINNVVIKYIGKQDMEKIMFSESTEIDYELFKENNMNAYCQTDLLLIDKKYDTLMKSNEVIEDVAQDFIIKKEIIDFKDSSLKLAYSTSPRKSIRLTHQDGDQNPLIINVNSSEESPKKKSIIMAPTEIIDKGAVKPRKSVIKFLEEGHINRDGIVSPRSPLLEGSGSSVLKINSAKGTEKQENLKESKRVSGFVINVSPVNEKSNKASPKELNPFQNGKLSGSGFSDVVSNKYNFDAEDNSKESELSVISEKYDEKESLMPSPEGKNIKSQTNFNFSEIKLQVNNNSPNSKESPSKKNEILSSGKKSTNEKINISEKSPKKNKEINVGDIKINEEEERKRSGSSGASSPEIGIKRQSSIKEKKKPLLSKKFSQVEEREGKSKFFRVNNKKNKTDKEIAQSESSSESDDQSLEKSTPANGQKLQKPANDSKKDKSKTKQDSRATPPIHPNLKIILNENFDYETGSAADMMETFTSDNNFIDNQVIKGISADMNSNNRRHSLALETGLKSFQKPVARKMPRSPTKKPTANLKEPIPKKGQKKNEDFLKLDLIHDLPEHSSEDEGKAGKSHRRDKSDNETKKLLLEKSSPIAKAKRGKVPPIKIQTQPQISNFEQHLSAPIAAGENFSFQSSWPAKVPINNNGISHEEAKDSLQKLTKFIKKSEKKGRAPENGEGVNNEEIDVDLEEEGEDEEDEVKFHIMQMIKLLKVENAKNDFYREKNHLYYVLLSDFLAFSKKLFELIASSLKISNPLLYEELHREYMALRRRLPREIDPTFEGEVQEHEHQHTLREKVKKTAKISKMLMNQPRLGIIKEKTVDRMNHPGWVLINKLKDKQFSKQIKGLFTIKNLMKTITLLYEEKLAMSKESSMIKEQDMPIFIFNHFLNKYGIKKVAEQKFSFFVLSVKLYVQTFRVNVFGRLLNIFDQNLNFSIDEVKKFIEGIDYLLYQCSMGYSVVHLETEVRRMVPYIRALDYLRFFGDNRLNQEEITELRKEMENMKEADPKNLNKTGIIDMDIFLLKMITKYRGVMNRTKEHVVTAFKAADLDGNKTCSLKEFILLYRHIESEKFNEEAVVKIFEEQCDIITDNETSMSFDKFTAVCVEYSLFSSASQDKYINIKNDKEMNESFARLKLEWDDKKLKIIEKMKTVEDFISSEDMETWATILEVLDLRVKKESIIEKKPVLIAVKIMNDELSRLMEEKEKESANESSEDQMSELELGPENN